MSEGFNIRVFRAYCKEQGYVPDATVIIRFDGDKLTVAQLHRIIFDMLKHVGWDPEWDVNSVSVDLVTAGEACDLAQAILDAWSPAERYEAGISMQFGKSEKPGGSWILVPEVTAGEGRAGA